MSRKRKVESLRYIEEFMGCRCAPELLAKKVFPNPKEITESFATYAAVREHLRGLVSFQDPTVGLLAVGDGHSPRTAMTFAYRSNWKCFSVDPKMGTRWTGGPLGVDRLTVSRAKILPVGGWNFPVESFSRIIVAAVHSHASLKDAVNTAFRVTNRVSVVSMPCCFKDDFSGADVSYEDPGVISPHRTLYVWRDLIGSDGASDPTTRESAHL